MNKSKLFLEFFNYDQEQNVYILIPEEAMAVYMVVDIHWLVATKSTLNKQMALVKGKCQNTVKFSKHILLHQKINLKKHWVSQNFSMKSLPKACILLFLVHRWLKYVCATPISGLNGIGRTEYLDILVATANLYSRGWEQRRAWSERGRKMKKNPCQEAPKERPAETKENKS